MTDVSTSSSLMGQFTSISREELQRARRRAGEPAWREAAARMRESAEKLMTEERPMPTFDSSWYDEEPERDFGETYVPFHDYGTPGWFLVRDAHTLLRAGAVLNEARYTERAVEWFLHMIEHWRFHVQHHDAGLVYSHFAEPMADFWRMCHDRLSGEQRKRLCEQMESCGEAILWNTRHWLANLTHMPYNNHYAAHRRGILTVGLVLGRDDWVSEAIDGARGFRELLAGATCDDGLCTESSTLYHYATYGGLARIAEIVRKHPSLGRDLWREVVANGRSLKQMLDAPLGLMLPNGELPPIGDCYAVRQPLWARSEHYELGFAIYGDPRYAWLLRQGGSRRSESALVHGADRLEPAEAPLGRSRVWIEHGYSLLVSRAGRGYWDTDAGGRPTGMAAFLTGDMSNVHHHNDKLGLVVSAGGKLWTEDVESQATELHGFSAPIQKAFNRTALAHNTVMVDEQDQRPIERRLGIVEFRELPAFRTVTMADFYGTLYEGVSMMRSVVVTPEYCLDLFQVRSDASHTLDWLVHPRADGAAEVATGGEAAAFGATTLPGHAPYEVLRNAAKAAMTTAGACLRWSQGDRAVRMDVRACTSMGEAVGGEIIRAEWPVQSDWATGGREMLAVRVGGDRVLFVALYQLAGGADETPWGVARVRRVFNGLFDEVHIRVDGPVDGRDHVLRGL